ncbi:M60 family metallopeptidase [Pedobacter sp.]|uniref:M60 family metallopeptidase n=1 Tax=Pedobacter sp. TaxID=1411316 RepID=UPI003BAD89D8
MNFKKNTKTIVLMTGLCLLVGISCKKAIKEEDNLQSFQKPSSLMINSNADITNTIGANIQEFNELKSSEQERKRLLLNYNGTDFDPTGFHIPANTELSVTVEKLAGNRLPKLLIGTYYRYFDAQGYEPLIVQLNEGINTISSGQYGGAMWIRYTTTETPNSKVKITFNNGHQKMPVFVKNKTTAADWSYQLENYTSSPDVLLMGNRVYQFFSRERALRYQTEGKDNNANLDVADRIWDYMNEFSGLDGSAPEHQLPVHNKILATETDHVGTGIGWAWTYGIYHIPSYCDKAFTLMNTTSGSNFWHETGHQHQQKTWTWSTLTEVTNQIYAILVQRKLGITPARLKKDNRWPAIKSYLADASATKDYNLNTGSEWVRVGLFQQLWLAYGDNFFISLHKKARTDKPALSTDADEMRWFMLSACSISGRNLTDFFKKWGFKVNESVYTEINNLGLPNPAQDLCALDDDVNGIPTGINYEIASALPSTYSMLFNVYQGVQYNGTLVNVYPDQNQISSRWKLTYAGDGYYQIESLVANKGRVLSVVEGSSADGTKLEIRDNTQSPAQRFKIVSTGNGYYTLSPACAPTKMVQVSGGTAKNNTPLVLGTANGGASQQFKFATY